MTLIEIAKNLLQNKTCYTCIFGYISLTMNPAPFCIKMHNHNGTYEDIPEKNTCSKWRAR